MTRVIRTSPMVSQHVTMFKSIEVRGWPHGRMKEYERHSGHFTLRMRNDGS